MIKYFRLAALGRLDQVVIKHLKDVFADLRKLGLDLLAVLLDQTHLALVALRFFFLLDRGNDSPRCTSCSDNILVGNGKQVSFFDRKLLICGCDVLHVLHHLCSSQIGIQFREDAWYEFTFVAFRLLGKLGKIDMIFVPHLASVSLRELLVETWAFLNDVWPADCAKCSR